MKGTKGSLRRLDCRQALTVVFDDLESELESGSDQAAAARSHVEACPNCRAEVTRELLVLTGLRRLGDLVRSTELPAASWARILARLAEADSGRQVEGGRLPRTRAKVSTLARSVVVDLDLAGVLASLLIAVALPAVIDGTVRSAAIEGGVAGPSGLAPVVRPWLETEDPVIDPRPHHEPGRPSIAGAIPATGTEAPWSVGPSANAPAPSVFLGTGDGTTAADPASGSGSLASVGPGDVSPGRTALSGSSGAAGAVGPQIGSAVGSLTDASAAGETVTPPSGTAAVPRKD